MATIPKFVLNQNVQHHELKLAESSPSGLLPNDPFWRYVEGRFNLALEGGHLARFEHYHPVITPLLEENLKALTPAPATVCPGTIPRIPMAPLVPVLPPLPLPVPELPGPPQTGSMAPVSPSVPSAVPEPSSVILASLGLFTALLVGWLVK